MKKRPMRLALLIRTLDLISICILSLLLLECSQKAKPTSNLLHLFTGSIPKPNATGVFTIGGNVQGLKGTLVLQNISKDNLSISSNGPFVFPTRLQGEDVYSVTVLNQPSNQNCVITEGLDVVYDTDVNSILVNCQTIPVRYTIGGILQQLKPGNRVTLFSNRGEELLLSANGNFQFKSGFTFGNSYSITVLAQPTNQNCILSNQSGRMPEANLTNLEVNCFGNAYGALINGTIINPLSFATGVTSFAGSYCNPDTICATGIAGFLDSTNPNLVQFNSPEGIITDGYYLYVADKSNHRIRKISLDTGETSTLAGNGVAAMSDGIGTFASLQSPQYLTTDGLNIYTIDLIQFAIRKINLNSLRVTTIISGSQSLAGSKGILVSNNNLYITDNTNKALRRINLSTGILTTIVTTTVSLTSPKGMAVLGNDIYMIDASRILKMTIGLWAISVFAGGSAGFTDGTGAAAKFNNPEGITTDGSNLYISDSSNHAIRQINIATSNVTTLAGPTTVSSGYSNSSVYGNALFDSPGGITSDGQSLYTVDKNNHALRKIR